MIYILYESHTGFTKKYAEGMAEALCGEAVALKQYRETLHGDADCLICGGGVHGTAINGLRKFERIRKVHPETPVVYFATGLRKANEETIRLLQQYNFRADNEIPFYYFRGGIDLEHMEQAQRMLLFALKSMLSRKNRRSEDEQELLKSLSFSGDYTSLDQCEPLIQAVQRMLGRASV